MIHTPCNAQNAGEVSHIGSGDSMRNLCDGKQWNVIVIGPDYQKLSFADDWSKAHISHVKRWHNDYPAWCHSWMPGMMWAGGVVHDEQECPWPVMSGKCSDAPEEVKGCHE
jgi:hypothetical protein